MTGMMKIDPLALHLEVIPIIAEWLFLEWGHRRTGSTLSEAISRLSARANTRDLPIAWVAVSPSGIPLATASLVEREEDTDEFGPWLASVYTIPSVRRLGFATALVRHAEKEACLMGFERILLATSKPIFYGSLGWYPMERTKYEERVMEKLIHSVL